MLDPHGERWSILGNGGPLATPFASDVCVAAGAAVAGGKVFTTSAEGSDGDAAVRLAVRRRGFWREAILPPFTPFSAIRAMAPPAEAAVHRHDSWLDRLAEAMESGPDRVILHLPPALTDPRPLQWRGWQVQPRFTYHIDLAPETDPLSRFSSATRRTLKKAVASYDCGEDPDALEAIIGLVGQAYRRRERPMLISEAALSAFAGTLIEAGHAFCFVARDTHIRAGVVVLHDGDTAYYWLAGSEPGPAMTVLIAALLPELAARGIRSFDLVGANTPSIAEFKRRLGAERIPYFAAEYIRSGTLKAALAVRRALIRS